MTQDCLNSTSTADVSQRLPKGIHIIGAEKPAAPKVEELSHRQPSKPAQDPSLLPTSWSYLYLQHQLARTFCKWLEAYNADDNRPTKQPFFVHHTYRYGYKNKETQQGVKKTLRPTVSGLVFLQGTVKSISDFLTLYWPNYHLVLDPCHNRSASIPDAVMQPFMRVMQTHPEQITFLRDPFDKFAKDHVKLRVLTGPFRGYEGYIVRIDRNRQLVFNFGGIAVALRGVHNEDFEVAD